MNTNVDTMSFIYDADEGALKHLTDIRLSLPSDHSDASFILEFHFSQNEFFRNDVLKLGFFYDKVSDSDLGASYHG